MALALILGFEPRPGGISVQYDIGKNHYLRWQLGEEKSRTGNGLPSLTGIRHRSGLIGPLQPTRLGRGELLIPYSDLAPDCPHLQLVSYRSEDGSGPALSAVAQIPGELFPAGRGNHGGDSPLPPPAGLALHQRAASLMDSKDGTMTAVAPVYTQTVDNIAFQLSEQKLSRPLFLEALVGALPGLASILVPAIGSIVSGPGPGMPAREDTSARSTRRGQDTARRVALDQLSSLAEQALRALGPEAQRILTPNDMRRIAQLIGAGTTARTERRASSTALAMNGYSHAQVAPALLAALPALMPLLQQVLSPETVQSVINAPQRMTGQVIDGIKDFARLGLEADQQLQQHLERLNPGVDDPALHQLLAGLSLQQASARRLAYKRVASVQLSIEAVQTQVIFGREQALYSHAAALQFPLSIQTPQTIRDAELILQLKQADTLRIVHEERESVGPVYNGPLGVIPRIEAEVTRTLDPMKDHIIVLTLLWKNRRGQARGTSIQHSISLMGTYRFDRVENSGELVPLDDRETYRDYWHQIWETDFDSHTRRVDIVSRYYLTIDPLRNRNARMDSEFRSSREGPREKVRLRSGYEYSLPALNHLLSRLSPVQSPLTEDVLQALASSDFVERFNQAAQHQGRLRGRPGDRGALWVYPEFKLQKLVLVEATRVNEHGNITELGERMVTFPMPVMLHFAGVTSE